MDNRILSNKEWKEPDYGNSLNTITDSFFKAHDERNIKEGNELRQMKRKGGNKNDEQPIKRVCKAEKFESIKYSLRPNKEYIANSTYLGLKKKYRLNLKNDMPPRDK
ncbi:hypothetical protein Tco_0991768 [Tanacetum coccineum]|uniref:Uncharacterized protein n=1 Tax=Tanacetum coccineum TaxID=301880 RepID=A0ABQ5F0I5_9ASTR